MDPSAITEQLGTITAIVALSLGIVQVFKLLLAKYKVGIVSDLPTPLLCIGVSMALAVIANVSGYLPGEWYNVLWQAMLASGTASGFFSWVKEPLDSPAKKADASASVKLPMTNKAAWLGVLMVPLVLMTGCGVETLSPGQQYDIASSSVRSVVDSLKAAGDNGLISDEDIVAIDPFVQQAFDSLRAMRTEALQGNSVKTQWYLTQVRQLVAKLLTMRETAKEMNDGGNRSSRSDGDTHWLGDYRDAYQGPGRSTRRQKAVYAQRACAGRSAQRAERVRVERNRICCESPTWRTAYPDPAIASGEPEREWD